MNKSREIVSTEKLRQALRVVKQPRTVLAVVIVLPILTGLVSGRGGSVGGTATRSASIPTWLTILTGGAVVAGSFVFTSFLTDHESVRDVNTRSLSLPEFPPLESVLKTAGELFGIATVAFVVYRGLVGTVRPQYNAAILIVWAGWWAGYSMSTYFIGNSWPILNPWKAIASRLPTLDRPYPERYGRWPSVAFLLLLVYVEVVTPVDSAPRLLSLVIVAYSAVTLAGAVVYGNETWFETVDPISGVFRVYGRIAPIQKTNDGYMVQFPGASLAESDTAASKDTVAFTIALLWGTSFDGVVTTGSWSRLARAIVESGVPYPLVYLFGLGTGFAVFYGAYRFAAARSRKRTETPVTTEFIEGWFVPALIPIAAAYHVAHYLTYFLGLSPALALAVSNPFAAPETLYTLTIPAWFINIKLLLIVAGHVLGVWIAHSLALSLFPGSLKPIRSQYPFIVVMVLYTMTGLWIIAQPYVNPAYV